MALHQLETPAATTRSASSLYPGILALEGGSVYAGRLFGAPVEAHGELIFTTAASGWGEIVSDPSYAGQIVVLTHPMVGNYRIRDDELESERVQARAIVASRLMEPPEGPGRSLHALLTGAGVPALSGIDTRALTLEIRRGARRRAVIHPVAGDPAERASAVEAARTSPSWDAVDHVATVSPRSPYVVAARGERRARAVLLDMGVKRSLLAALAARGLEIAAYPHDATAEALLATGPDLVVLSPGPGDPARMEPQIDTVRQLAAAALDGGPPVLGICLGHQLLALAAGAATRRLVVGHHGGNHAVREEPSGRVDIGAHNHEVTVVDDERLRAAEYRVTHRDLNDGTVEGLAHASGRIASVQFHPEGAPGPTDAARIFDLALDACRAAS
ncbi:MAG: glutamine-hydrolyzing carbamoyl-phosphate synthase small subunit [Candidatus Limnocylindria bacterium]